jgi:hypothetical protein
MIKIFKISLLASLVALTGCQSCCPGNYSSGVVTPPNNFSSGVTTPVHAQAGYYPPVVTPPVHAQSVVIPIHPQANNFSSGVTTPVNGQTGISSGVTTPVHAQAGNFSSLKSSVVKTTVNHLSS